MPEKIIHFEPMSDKTKFVEMSHAGQKVGNSIMQLMKEHKATILDDGGSGRLLSV